MSRVNERWIDRLARRLAGEKKPNPYAGCLKARRIQNARFRYRDIPPPPEGSRR